MKSEKRAKELVSLHGAQNANKIIDSIITELQLDWN